MSSPRLRFLASPAPADDPHPNHPVADDCAALTINFNTARQTVRNVQSLLAGSLIPATILVLDNASHSDDLHWLHTHLPQHPRCDIRLYRSDTNLGFAGGSNALLQHALAQPHIQYTLLLNNDAVAQPPLLQQLRQALIDGQADNIHMAGARMHRLSNPDEVDTLGIALYASLMPADRKTLDDPFVGPTGGCALYSRHLLDALHQASGYWFDERFFCYCEDTDLALRARALGLGAAYLDHCLALHEGQASSRTAASDFIAYHGLRNSIWMQLKLIPTATLIKHLPLLALAHCASIVRYLLSGRIRVLLRVYRDAWAGRRPILAERRHWHQQAPNSRALLRALITPRFYRKGYLRMLLSNMRAPKQNP